VISAAIIAVMYREFDSHVIDSIYSPIFNDWDASYASLTRTMACFVAKLNARYSYFQLHRLQTSRHARNSSCLPTDRESKLDSNNEYKVHSTSQAYSYGHLPNEAAANLQDG
jgi:hypothetical protein